MARRFLMTAAAIAALAVSCIADAAEVSVLSGGAMKSAFVEAAAAWEKTSGHRVKVAFEPAGEIHRRLAAGERHDLVILPAEAFEALERDGVVRAGSARPIAAVAIAIAVREGAPVPDISTPDAVKRLLVAAKSLTYMDPARGTSGKYVDEVVLPKLGVRDDVRARTKFGTGGAIAERVARGEVEIAIHQLTEILPVAGVTVIGLLPPELQKVTVYSGAIMPSAARPAEAASFLDFLVSREARPLFAARGFTAP